MNLTVEHVLMFVLVFCAFYYLKNGCGCKEGMSPGEAGGKEKLCAENWANLQNMSADQIKEYTKYYNMMLRAAEAKSALQIKAARQYYNDNVSHREAQISLTLQDIYNDKC
uniref:Uncharacterized protein n=1 Tax=viral metagenome TaxID=1070528 RepID=A0A6C0FBR7_9ZZZZ|tara:strand:+ start:305 stop:637 length:333 start_codon:yes stop_codon:yes gene_type:complete